MRKPRYRYHYKFVCWLIMEHEAAYNRFPMLLHCAMPANEKIRLAMDNQFSSGRPYTC